MERKLFWPAAALLTLAIYWFCLRVFFPGYFTPLAPFHPDFYGYVSLARQSVANLALRYPRPVSNLGMWALAFGGLKGLMAGGIAIALANVLLTLALTRKLFDLTTGWRLTALYGFYAFLLFAHPQFYIEHRHDLPAEISYLFLAISLLAWLAAAEGPKLRTPPLIAAIVFAILFALAKETYFVSAGLIVLSLAVVSARPQRMRHVSFLIFLAVIEAASLQWGNHFKGPFVNTAADAQSTYHISLSPADVTSTYWFYLTNLLNPGLILLAFAGVFCVWRDRRRLILAAALPLAGLSVFATLAVLPNHKFEEYAWAGASLFLAPVLLLRAKAVYWSVAAGCLVLAFAGPGGYGRAWNSDVARWWVARDRKTDLLANSFARLEAIPAPARVLVAGLDDETVPWQAEDFVRIQFGDRLHWTVVLPPEERFRHNSSLATFIDPAQVDLSKYDYLASYHPTGQLIGIRPVDAAAGGQLTRLLRESGEPIARPELFDKPELTANPAVIIHPGGNGLGITELTWNVAEGIQVEIHVNAPNGALFARGGKTGSARTDKWVTNGMTFFLQDVTGGKPLTDENTIAAARIEVQ